MLPLPLYWVCHKRARWAILTLSSHFIICPPLWYWKCGDSTDVLLLYSHIIDWCRWSKWATPPLASHFFIYHLSSTGSTEHEIGLLQKKRVGSIATRFSLQYLPPSARCNFLSYSLILGWAEEKWAILHSCLTFFLATALQYRQLRGGSDMLPLYWIGLVQMRTVGSTATCIPCPHLLLQYLGVWWRLNAFYGIKFIYYTWS